LLVRFVEQRLNTFLEAALNNFSFIIDDPNKSYVPVDLDNSVAEAGLLHG
jgi:hypothetical protein